MVTAFLFEKRRGVTNTSAAPDPLQLALTYLIGPIYEGAGTSAL